jgi:hypothetical protein
MTEQTNEISAAAPPAGETKAHWPDDDIEMLNEMMREQASSLHAMFYDLRDFSAQTFAESPQAAQAYIRLALRAQANARSSMEAIARAHRATQRSLEERKK